MGSRLTGRTWLLLRLVSKGTKVLLFLQKVIQMIVSNQEDVVDDDNVQDEEGDMGLTEKDGEKEEEQVGEEEEDTNLPGQVDEEEEGDAKEGEEGGEQPTPEDDPAADEADGLDM